MVESHTEDRKYLCRFDPSNEILKRLYEIVETSKKQDLTPPWEPEMFLTLTTFYGDAICRGLRLRGLQLRRAKEE